MFKSVGEIRDPVHGYISMSAVEKSLIDSSTFQRLRRLRQLSGAHLTYPGAEHSRFTHSLGVMHLAGKIAARLQSLGFLSEEECQRVRIAGLLHDVGHGPFSHVYEEVLDKYRRMTHEDIGMWLIEQGELKDILNSYGYSPTDLSKLAVGKAEGGANARLNQIMASQLDADIMDYLVRDSHFCGVEYGNIDIERLISSIDFVNGRLAIDVASVYALEAFVIARYEMFKAVYFHRTVRAAEVMVIRAMDYANEELGLTSFRTPEEFLRLDDSSVTQSLLNIDPKENKSLKVAKDLAQRYVNRCIFKAVHEQVMHRRSDFYINILIRDDVRAQLAKEIGEKADVDSDYIFIDVPTVASVPYYPLQQRPSEIPVFETQPDGTKRLRNLSDYSQIIPALVGYLDILRVYTAPEYRKKVADAAYSVLGQRPYSSKITM
ncbi:MAG: HD domain-containing protein [Candidatus Bathyarchaeia archaeon]